VVEGFVLGVDGPRRIAEVRKEVFETEASALLYERDGTIGLEIVGFGPEGHEGVEAMRVVEGETAREVHQWAVPKCRVVGDEAFEGVITDGQQNDIGIAQGIGGRMWESVVPTRNRLAFKLEVAGHMKGHSAAADQPIGG